MRRLLLLGLLGAACGTTPKGEGPRGGSEAAPEPLPEEIREQEQDLLVERGAQGFTQEQPVPKPSAEEIADFERVWELFRREDPRWPLERERFRQRSEAAGYLLAGHLLRFYMQANAARERAARQLVRAKDEIVAVGDPCAPYLVDMLILDSIPTREGQPFLIDDLTRQDCSEMLERMGPVGATPLLVALGREDLNRKGRRLVALALGGTRDRRAYEPLVALLRKDPSWQVRADAATALGRLGDVRAIGPLSEAVQKDADLTVAQRAGKARFELSRGADR